MSTINALNNLLFDLVDTVSKAAISCYPWIGKGNEDAADRAAVESLRNSLNALQISGTVVIGEGERDKAPMLYIGEKLGKSGPEIDIAVDPLEGTTICANNKPNSLSVLAVSSKNTMLAAPDLYMEKIAIGANLPKNLVDLDQPLHTNLEALAKSKNKDISDLMICVLKRDRHIELIQELRSHNTKVTLIDDGDVLACLKTCIFGSDIDMYIGTGGAPEGVLAAAALKCLGGQIQTRLIANTQTQIDHALSMGIQDLSRKYSQDDMIKGDVFFLASWITDGVLQGIKKLHSSTAVNTLLLSSTPKAMRFIKTEYHHDHRR